MRLFRAFLLLALLTGFQTASAQVRERPVAFDSSGRITVITAPLAARLGLSAPLWPVSGDYIDARLYALDEASTSFVLVVRRQREVLERYPLDASARSALGAAVDRGGFGTRAGVQPDVLPTYISEPVRGSFVLNQTLLGALVFGPAAGTIVADPAGSTAAYLAVTGGAFFIAANLTQSTTVSRAQNHLSWHSARRGAIAANMALFAITGDDNDDNGKAAAGALLAGGIAGDVVGFALGKPMTDAEAHGTSHGSTITAALTGGLIGSLGAFDHGEGGARAGVLGIIGAGALGYPLGLRYVRTAPYRVTAGDVGTMFPVEMLGLAAIATFIPTDTWEDHPHLSAGLLTAGFGLGALAADRFLVRPFDHTEAEARLLNYGVVAGGLIGIALPVLASADNPNVYFGAATLGGILGAAMTTNYMKPQPARVGFGRIPSTRVGQKSASRVDLRFTPEGAIMAGLGTRGNHSLLSVTF